MNEIKRLALAKIKFNLSSKYHSLSKKTKSLGKKKNLYRKSKMYKNQGLALVDSVSFPDFNS